MSTNDDYRKQWDQITDPYKMLATIVEFEDFLGYDPYYKDLRESLLKNAERIAKHGHPTH